MPSSLFSSVAKTGNKAFLFAQKGHNGGSHAVIKKIAGVLVDTQLTQNK